MKATFRSERQTSKVSDAILSPNRDQIISCPPNYSPSELRRSSEKQRKRGNDRCVFSSYRRGCVMFVKVDLFISADSEKFLEMEAATETPPKQCFLLDDDGEFPPMVPTVQ